MTGDHAEARLAGVRPAQTGGGDTPEQDPRKAARETRAKHYFKHDLKDQQDWYSERAGTSRRWARLLGLAVIVAGALVAAVQAFGGGPAIAIITAFLGGIAAVAESWQQIARYAETWMAYRIASERMKRERRLYVNGAGEYRTIEDEEEAFLRFVENVEAVIAEEQQIYWSHRGGRSSPSEEGTQPTLGTTRAGQG